MTGPESIGARALAVAVQYVGVPETPPGSNCTPFGEWFGENGRPWCAMFVSYCFVRGADYELCAGFDGPGVRAGRGCAWVPTIEAWARARGLLLSATDTPVPGDLALLDWNGDGAPEHIAIVETDHGGGLFGTVEGNVGNMVARGRRGRDQLVGLVRITG